MHDAEYVLENDTHKLLWDLEIEMDHPIIARRPDQVIIPHPRKKKRTCRKVLCRRLKLKENEKKDKYLNLA